MLFYSLLSLSAFLITLLGARLAILAGRKRVVTADILGSLRPGYKKAAPEGGLVVFMALTICLLAADINYAIVLAMFLLATVSLLHNVIPIPLPVRLLVQLLAVLIALQVLAAPVFGGVLPPWLDKAVTALLWVWFINLFALMDGIDGISPTEMIGIGMGVCIITAIVGGDFPSPLATYGLIVGAAGCGFLWWNWHPARILLGSSGAVPIGFLLGYLLLLAVKSGYPYVAIILPAYHLSDATLTMLRRLYKGRDPRAPLMDYYYLRALRSGRRQDSVVRYIFGVNFLLLFNATFSVIDPGLAPVYAAAAYASVFMLLGFFEYTAHDPDYEPF